MEVQETDLLIPPPGRATAAFQDHPSPEEAGAVEAAHPRAVVVEAGLPRVISDWIKKPEWV